MKTSYKSQNLSPEALAIAAEDGYISRLKVRKS